LKKTGKNVEKILIFSLIHWENAGMHYDFTSKDDLFKGELVTMNINEW